MISVSSAWKNAQSMQILPEGNVRITFENGVVLDKTNFKNFKYTQSGSITNQKLVSKEIQFDIFMLNTYNFTLHSYCKVEFGLRINGSWEWVLVGSFQVFDRNIPQNGLIATYSLNNAFISSVFLDEIYKKGSNQDYDGDDMSLHSLLLTAFSGRSNDLPTLACGKSLSQVSFAEVLQLAGSACGRTANIVRANTGNIKENTKFEFTAYDNDGDDIDYIITPEFQYKYPEFIVEDAIAYFNLNIYENSEIEEEIGTKFTIVVLTNEFDYEEGERGLEAGTYTVGESRPIDPSKFWNVVDTTGDCAGKITENYVFMYTYEGRVGSRVGYILSRMETQSNPIPYRVGGLGYVGTTVSIDNVLVNDDYKDMCASYYQEWLENNVVLDCSFRIDPRLELFDKVIIRDKQNNDHYGICELVKITFNGAFRGKVKAREFYPDEKPEAYINHKTIVVQDFTQGRECVIENMSSLSVFLNMQTTGANGMIWKRRNRQTLEVIDEFEVPCGRIAIGQKTDPDTKEVLGKYLGVYEHTTGSQYRLLEPNPISTEFNSGNEIWTITLKSGYSLHFSRSGYERYLLDNFSGYIDYR